MQKVMLMGMHWHISECARANYAHLHTFEVSVYIRVGIHSVSFTTKGFPRASIGDEQQWIPTFSYFSIQLWVSVGLVVMAAKPFIKWVGGKGQLLQQLEEKLPVNFDLLNEVVYIEPFVGGGAMLFHMLQQHPNISHAIINDVNPDLTTCYEVVKTQPDNLIRSLQDIQQEYYTLSTEETRRNFYLQMRERFNTKALSPIENTTLFFFLNRTCFNGLYRVNKKGLFNVPFGRYEHPTICDVDTIYADSELLQRVTILTGDYQQTLNYAGNHTLFYFDPPYRPLSETSSFNDYSAEAFDDHAQIRLKMFCDQVHAAGHSFMLSNADCFSHNGDRFFEDLYADYTIRRVWASRNVNANASKRGKLQELLICNFIPD